MIVPARDGLMASSRAASHITSVPPMLRRVTAFQPLAVMPSAGTKYWPPALLSSTSTRPWRSSAVAITDVTGDPGAALAQMRGGLLQHLGATAGDDDGGAAPHEFLRCRLAE